MQGDWSVTKTAKNAGFMPVFFLFSVIANIKQFTKNVKFHFTHFVKLTIVILRGDNYDQTKIT